MELAFSENIDTFQSALLDTVVQNSRDLFAVQRKADRAIVYINKGGIEMFDSESQAALGAQIENLSILKEPPVSVTSFNDTVISRIAIEGSFTTETEFVTSKGKSFWGTLRITPVYNSCGDFMLIQIINTQRLHTSENSYKRQIYKYEALFNHANIGIVVSDKSGTIVAVNLHLINQFGYETEDELKNKKIEILMAPNIRERHTANRNIYLINPHHKPMGHGMDVLAVKKDGTPFPVEVSISYFELDGADFAYSFISDVTQRKNSEAEVKTLNAELEKKVKQKTGELELAITDLKTHMQRSEQAKEQLSKALNFQESLLHNAGVMVIAINEKGVISLFNQKAEKLLGYSSAEITGKASPDLFHTESFIEQPVDALEDEGRKKEKFGYEEFVKRAGIYGSYEHECLYRRKDGHTFPVLLTVTALRNDEGKVTGYLGIATDISERKKAEELLLSSLKKEKELNEMKSRFVSMASHEFRTPLSTIASSAFLISKYRTADDQEKREKHIGKISSSVNILTETLNDFLSVGKIEEGTIKVNWKSFDVNNYISGVIKEMENLLKPGQKVIYHHTGDPIVILDPSLLKHIIQNLLTNAIKFSGEDKEIEIISAESKGSFKLTIKDNGLGIPDADKAHLFQRFFRGSNVINIHGTGLGLSIVKNYAELMNGSISCESEMDKGTSFVLSFKNNKDLSKTIVEKMSNFCPL